MMAQLLDFLNTGKSEAFRPGFNDRSEEFPGLMGREPGCIGRDRANFGAMRIEQVHTCRKMVIKIGGDILDFARGYDLPVRATQFQSEGTYFEIGGGLHRWDWPPGSHGRTWPRCPLRRRVILAEEHPADAWQEGRAQESEEQLADSAAPACASF